MRRLELARRRGLALVALVLVCLAVGACSSAEDEDELRSRYHGVDAGPWHVTDDIHGTGP